MMGILTPPHQSEPHTIPPDTEAERAYAVIYWQTRAAEAPELATVIELWQDALRLRPAIVRRGLP